MLLLVVHACPRSQRRVGRAASYRVPDVHKSFRARDVDDVLPYLTRRRTVMGLPTGSSGCSPLRMNAALSAPLTFERESVRVAPLVDALR